MARNYKNLLEIRISVKIRILFETFKQHSGCKSLIAKTFDENSLKMKEAKSFFLFLSAQSGAKIKLRLKNQAFRNIFVRFFLWFGTNISHNQQGHSLHIRYLMLLLKKLISLLKLFW